MSYARGGLGMKFIPGQVNFLDPYGSNPERQEQRAIRRGLPYAPYIEHGSYATGQPDIVQWDHDPYRGMMGLGDSGDGLGQLLTDMACSGSALNANWTTRTRDALGAALQAAVVGSVVAGLVGAVSKKPAVGALSGAMIGFGIFRVWTAPYAL